MVTHRGPPRWAMATVDGHHRVGQRFQRARGHAFVAARYFSCVKRHYDDVVT